MNSIVNSIVAQAVDTPRVTSVLLATVERLRGSVAGHARSRLALIVTRHA